MAKAAGYGSPLGQRMAAFGLEDPVGRDLGKHRAFPSLAVAGPAVIPVIFRKARVSPVIPVGVVDVVEPVGAVDGPGQVRAVAGGAFDDGSVMPLDLPGGDIVIGPVPGGPFRVGAAVAGLTGHPVVPQAEAEQGIVFLRKPLVNGVPGRGRGVGGDVSPA